MLRTEIISGLENLLTSLAAADVPDVVERVYRDISRQGGDPVKTTDVLVCYQKFLMSYTGKFTEVEKRIMRVLDIQEFAETDWWGSVIAATGGGAQVPDPASIGRPLYRLRFVIDYVPNVISLLKQDTPPPFHRPCRRQDRGVEFRGEPVPHARSAPKDRRPQPTPADCDRPTWRASRRH